VEVGLHTVSDEGGHGNSAVLDFSMTQKANSGFVCVLPELSLGKVEGIKEVDSWVELGSKSLKVGLGSRKPGLGAALLGRGERRGDRSGGEECSSGELHVGQCCVKRVEQRNLVLQSTLFSSTCTKAISYTKNRETRFMI